MKFDHLPTRFAAFTLKTNYAIRTFYTPCCDKIYYYYDNALFNHVNNAMFST